MFLFIDDSFKNPYQIFKKQNTINSQSKLCSYQLDNEIISILDNSFNSSLNNETHKISLNSRCHYH